MDAAYQRERMAGLCAAHGFKLVSLRRIEGGDYQVTISNRQNHIERISGPLPTLFEIVYERVNEGV